MAALAAGDERGKKRSGRQSGWWQDGAGFTLLEMLIAAVLMVTVVGAAYALLQQGALSWQVQVAREEAQDSLRVALARMGKYGREAAAVKVDENHSALTLKWWDANETNPDKQWKEIRYQVKDGVLKEGRASGPRIGWLINPSYNWRVLADRVVGAEFELKPVEGEGDCRLVEIALRAQDRRGTERRVKVAFLARAVLLP
ncbi:MAG: prepilin-type N-terminal cleavage/methylation domain-containing protein [Clostridia bacterium]|jgi:prepilin-type N-terminal cleavage/methylation domain-containing protein|nr:prepilin-type N-terminal cleavage/methylation domain-containing protein [Clostridia bacterium]MDH7572636.1 prepilin-type N-terminal cleavage/methylation domain-containing protein [Clostridia bacterium]